jgi:hypothetical protein
VEIDASAPAVARSEIAIAAAAEVVWDVLVDVTDWPSWNRDVKAATLDGPIAEGTRFQWKAGPGTIKSTFQRVEPPRLIGWKGTTFGIRAIHVHRLEPRVDQTVVTSHESWDGLLVRLLRGKMASTLQNSLDSGLRYLKAEAQRRATLTTRS